MTALDDCIGSQQLVREQHSMAELGCWLDPIPASPIRSLHFVSIVSINYPLSRSPLDLCGQMKIFKDNRYMERTN